MASTAKNFAQKSRNQSETLALRNIMIFHIKLGVKEQRNHDRTLFTSEIIRATNRA